MAKYRVRFSELQEQAKGLHAVGRRIDSLHRDLTAVSRAIDTRDTSMDTIQTRLLEAARELSNLASTMDRASDAIATVSHAYLSAEKSCYNNIENAEEWSAPGSWIASALLDFGLLDTLTQGFHEEKVKAEWTKYSHSTTDSAMQATWGFLALDLLKRSDEWSLTANSKYKKDLEKDLKEKYGVELPKMKEKSFRKTAHKLGDDQLMFYEMAPKKAKKVGSVLEGELKKELKGSLVEFGYKNKGLDANIKVGAAEGHAQIAGGLYVYNKDDKPVFAPGVSAEVGASVSALSGAVGYKVGNDLVSASTKLEAQALGAEAKAGVEAGWINGQLQANAEAKAEAVLVEAKGKAGLSVLGADVAVKGSVKVGIGAHAEVGIVDGVVKVDIGASLGVGVSVGFEVDVRGAVNAVVDKATSVWNTLTSWF
ncbi:MAG: hypothetical protein Q4A52_02140 [Bacillota bacterium]|nr:hypothetical protein [Bacillota bacterium]